MYMKNNLGALVALIAALLVAGASAEVSEPTYVIFSIMAPQALGPEIINGILQPEDICIRLKKIRSKK